VELWDHSRSSPIQSFEWGCEAVYCARFNPAECSLIAATAADNTIGIYDIRANTPIRKVLLQLRSNAICWNPMQPMNFTVANEDRNLYTFDLRKLDAAHNIHKDFTAPVLDVDYSPSGREFVASSYDRSIRIFRTDEGRSRDVYHTKRMQMVLSCRFSSDCRYVLSGSGDFCVRVWKAKASEPIGPRSYREKRAVAYRAALIEKYRNVVAVKKIVRHHHVPKYIKSASEKFRVMRAAVKRKEKNRREHSKPGTMPQVPERKKPIRKQIE